MILDEGNFKYGKPDGFGKLKYDNGGIYFGFFSDGSRHGIGTFNYKKIVRKGEWCRDQKHGRFIQSNKKNKKSRIEYWRYDKLQHCKMIKWNHPSNLKTTKTVTNVCFICCTHESNSTMNQCGHTGFCYNCIAELDNCPICRKKGNALKLFSI